MQVSDYLSSGFIDTSQLFIETRVPDRATVYVKTPPSRPPLFDPDLFNEFNAFTDIRTVRVLEPGRQVCPTAFVCDAAERPLFILVAEPAPNGQMFLGLAEFINLDGDLVDPLIVLDHTAVLGPTGETRFRDMTHDSVGSLSRGHYFEQGWFIFDCDDQNPTPRSLGRSESTG